MIPESFSHARRMLVDVAGLGVFVSVGLRNPFIIAFGIFHDDIHLVVRDSNRPCKKEVW